MSIITSILLGLLGLLAFLVLIAVIRTIFSKSSTTNEKPVACSEQRKKDYADSFAKMIQVPSVSKNADEDLSEFYKLHEVLEHEFPLLHKTCNKVVIDGNLLFFWKGTDDKLLPILFMAHQDVVPANDDGWKYPAFSGHVEQDVMYGRGTMDSKCNIFVQMQAIEELIKEGFTPKCSVYLAYGTNEESGGDGAPSIVRYLKSKNIRLEMVIDEGGGILDNPMPGMNKPYAMIGIAEKGYADLVIKSSNRGGHSSTPPKNTPIVQLSKFIAEMDKKRPFKRKLLPEIIEMFSSLSPSMNFGMRLLLGNLWLFKPLVMLVMPMVSSYGEALMQTTICFTMCKGSDAENVIPKEAYVIANIRTSVQQNLESSIAVVKKMASKYGLTVELKPKTAREASSCTNTKGPQFKYLSDCLKTCFPEIGISPYFVMGGTDARHYYAVTDCAFRFMPIMSTNEQTMLCHSINENIFVSSLPRAVDYFKYFLKNYNLK